MKLDASDVRIALKPLRALLTSGLLALLAALPGPTAAEELIDNAAVAEVLGKPDGLIAHIESEYNDIFVTKQQQHLSMSFRRDSAMFLESTNNLRDPADLPVSYTQMMTVGVVYPAESRRMLMIGLGAGSATTYLARFMPDLAIDTVELDPAVIGAAKKYFGLRETERIRFAANDGRVFLVRSKEPYDLIMLDAFRGGYVPFHLLTREFYTIVKDRLTPSGVAVFNVNLGTKLAASTLATLRAVFANVDLYTNSGGNIIAVATAQPKPDDDVLMQKAAALQAKHNFRYSLTRLLHDRLDEPTPAGAPVLTDDFAPVHLFDAVKEQNKKRW